MKACYLTVLLLGLMAANTVSAAEPDSPLSVYDISWEHDGIKHYVSHHTYAMCPSSLGEAPGWWHVSLLRAMHYAMFDYYGIGITFDVTIRQQLYGLQPEYNAKPVQNPIDAIRRTPHNDPLLIGIGVTIKDAFDGRVIKADRYNYRMTAKPWDETQKIYFDPHPGRGIKAREAMWGLMTPLYVPVQMLALHWPNPDKDADARTIARKDTNEYAVLNWVGLSPKDNRGKYQREKVPYPATNPWQADSALCIQYQAERMRFNNQTSTAQDQLLHQALTELQLPPLGRFRTPDEGQGR